MSATAITNITYQPNLGSTPARVNRLTGELQINLALWNQIKPEHRFFILLHELGHLALQTSDEKAVDNWAFHHYAENGYSLKEGVYALSKVLNGKSPEHYWRIYLQLERAKNYDFLHYGNVSAKFNNNEEMMTTNQEDYLRTMINSEQFWDSFKGKKEAKLARKKERAESKGYRRRTKADAEMELAKHGIAKPTFGQKIGEFMDKAGGIASGIMGGGLKQVFSDPTQTESPTGTRLANPNLTTPIKPTPIEDETDNKKKYLLIGGGLLVVIIVVFFVTKK